MRSAERKWLVAGYFSSYSMLLNPRHCETPTGVAAILKPAC